MIPHPTKPKRVFGATRERLAFRQRVASLRSLGLSHRAIADELGTTRGRVQEALRRAGGAPAMPGWRVRVAVKEDFALGRSKERLAEDFGLTVQQIELCLGKEHWSS